MHTKMTSETLKRNRLNTITVGLSSFGFGASTKAWVVDGRPKGTNRNSKGRTKTNNSSDDEDGDEAVGDESSSCHEDKGVNN